MRQLTVQVLSGKSKSVLAIALKDSLRTTVSEDRTLKGDRALVRQEYTEDRYSFPAKFKQDIPGWNTSQKN